MKLPKKDGLNIVPFIDIMLVLLAIVLSISTFIAHNSIKVDLPSVKNAAKEDKQDKVEISINANSQIFIANERVFENELSQKLQDINPQTLIILRSDKEAHFESFVSVIDALKQKEHKNFAILTEQK
ncbi:MAG: TonB system transport protein ExbD [Candidatus Campylobacter infans]|nr:MAG: TonB system transport protein ExbD [Candidatus Campylobacter infans]